MPSKVEKIALVVRAEPRSKIELILVKGGWTKPLSPQPPSTPEGKIAMAVEDAYVLRQWGMQVSQNGDKYAKLKEIILNKAEFELLKNFKG